MIEAHVPPLETCKRLKEAGFPQRSFFKYRNFKGYRYFEYVINPTDDDIAAPILTELLEQLPTDHEDRVLGWGSLACHRTVQSGFQIGYDVFDDESGVYEGMNPISTRRNPAEAAALLWLKLHDPETLP